MTYIARILTWKRRSEKRGLGRGDPHGQKKEGGGGVPFLLVLGKLGREEVSLGSLRKGGALDRRAE